MPNMHARTVCKSVSWRYINYTVPCQQTSVWNGELIVIFLFLKKRHAGLWQWFRGTRLWGVDLRTRAPPSHARRCVSSLHLIRTSIIRRSTWLERAYRDMLRICSKNVFLGWIGRSSCSIDPCQKQRHFILSIDWPHSQEVCISRWSIIMRLLVNRCVFLLLGFVVVFTLTAVSD